MPSSEKDSTSAADESRAANKQGGVVLCRSDALRERGTAHGWELRIDGEAARGFALRIDGRAVAYLNRCVHVAAEMDWNPNEFLDNQGERIVCALHGATYDPESGRCLGGPCGRQSLLPLRVDEADGVVRWYPEGRVSV
jgi:nitrite reductase/ring-hydroxylating ferredoxin subunit